MGIPARQNKFGQAGATVISPAFSVNPLMFWQSFATNVCIITAALILARRLVTFIRAKSKGSCGACSNCSAATPDTQNVKLVQLGVLPVEMQK